MKRGKAPRVEWQDPRYCTTCKRIWHECWCGENEERPAFLPCVRCGKRYAEHETRDVPSWTTREWREQIPLCVDGAEFLGGLRVRVR